MEEYILIKKDTLERFVENWIMQDRQDEFLEKIKHHSEVVQEVEIDAIRTKHFKDTNQHFNIDKKWTQNWIYNNIKILKTIEK